MPKPPAPDSRLNLKPADWLAWFDGSCKPNPGDCQIACILQGPDGQRITHTQAAGHGDSSDAEYQALILCLQLAQRHVAPSQSLRIHGDSQVVIDDVLARYGKTSALLAHYRERCLQLLSALANTQTACDLQWIPRHKNIEADQLMRAQS
ncbi:ribonuclease HI family protein [Undibacterium rugosum]|uniref:ribonuclease HI family protein n=1 Tax=Undibacterium rugosum TaxID=2762291 RepID=UPI001B842130|nr:ribonuclease HI family protein [Undibacterium rugosum]MBR7778786.1 ribonuclease HI family protein [Undibacterium rugosum]